MPQRRPNRGLSGRRPNVMFVLMDDMGFSDAGCYGGEIETPNLDRLAANGVRFTQFYNTGRCWPTRSSLLTGYYAPQVCMDPPTGALPIWQRLIPHYLRPLGYRSYHSGKWHVNNMKDPERQGEFDISWGFDIEQSKHFFDSGRGKQFSSAAITDHALDCLRRHQADHAGTPFFHYVCYTAPHFPVQAEQTDIEKYLGRYDEGWDAMRTKRWQRLRQMGIVNCALSDREPELRSPGYDDSFGPQYGPGEIEYAVGWDRLSAEQKRFQATKMAIHAAMIDRTDREIGRLLDQLKEMGVFEDTLIFFMSDNGASSEILIRGGGHDPKAAPGSVTTHLCLGPGWATCSNSPFRRHKVWVHEGGVATPLIAHWPHGIASKGTLRHDPGHCIDVLPTILDLAGVAKEDIVTPEGAPPFPGLSLVPTLEQDGSVRHDHIYFNHQGNRALRVGDWKIVSAADNVVRRMEGDKWQLHDLVVDRCEMVDLSRERPAQLEEMCKLWEHCERLYRTVC